MIHGEKKSSNHVSSKKYRGRGGRRSRYIAIQNFILFNIISLESRYVAAMAEWLRRWTRNPMGSSRAGSNPARSDFTFYFLHKVLRLYVKVLIRTMRGIFAQFQKKML